MHDVLIIGGGPAGATIGLLLARAGWSVALVEKQQFPRRKVCGEFISATTLPLLKKLSIADFYTEQGGPQVRRVGLFALDSILTSPMPPGNHSLGKWGRALGRELLDTLLLQQAVQAGVQLYQPWSAVDYQDLQSHFICNIKNKQQSAVLSAKMIIVAQGSWERNITQQNNIAHQRNDFLAFKAHFRNSQLDEDLMPLLAFPWGYGGLVNTDQGRITLSCSIRRDALEILRKKMPGLQAGEVVCQHIINTCRGAKNVLENAQREGAWLSVGPLKPGIHTRYQNGLFFIGNIAGEAHPIVAEGISMAMQSAWLLSQILIRRRKECTNRKDLASIGQEYTKQWNTAFANRVRASIFFTHLATRPKAVSLILPLFKQFPNMITYGAKLSGKIHQIVI